MVDVFASNSFNDSCNSTFSFVQFNRWQYEFNDHSEHADFLPLIPKDRQERSSMAESGYRFDGYTPCLLHAQKTASLLVIVDGEKSKFLEGNSSRYTTEMILWSMILILHYKG